MTNERKAAMAALAALILALEIWPMMTLIRWRMGQGRGTLAPIEGLRASARRIARISNGLRVDR